MSKVTTRVPATSANLGPGFDALGAALKLYNYVAVSPAAVFPKDAFIMEIARMFFKKIRRKAVPFAVSVRGDVPISSGLGSSVTVRMGVLYGLNVLHKNILRPEEILDLVIALEGHPDNAAPAFTGGFTASSAERRFHCRISPKLNFVAALPSQEIATPKARSILPKKIERAHVVANLQNTALISAAFASKKYEHLKGTSADHLHQPSRAKLIPGFYQTVQAAEENGALSAYLSGSGPVIMALTLKDPRKVGRAMSQSLKRAGHSNVRIKILKPDNEGARVIN